MRSCFFKSPAVKAFACDVNEHKAKYRVRGKTVPAAVFHRVLIISRVF